MNIHYDLSENKNVVLALGFFDGVHAAHQKIIKKTVEIAKKNNTKSALITFKVSPSAIILNKKPIYITKSEDKIKLIQNLGIDEIYILDFEKFKNFEAKEYIEKVLIKYFHPNSIVTGFNHTFGKMRRGDSKLLKAWGDFEYFETEPFYVQNYLVSSTRIKEFIKNGEIELANEMLNRNFSFKGTVIEGNKIAGKLGYKTANLKWNEDIVTPKYGVYKAMVQFEGQNYRGILNFGVRPSVDKTLTQTLEVHLIDYSGNLYGKTIEVEFVKKIRDEIKFDSLDELKCQIDKDYKAVTAL